MRVWTHHSSTFPLTDPNLRIDPTLGQYWEDERYRHALSRLHVLLDEKDFLWCCTERGTFDRTTAAIDLVEWELNVPDSQVLSLYRSDVWEDIYHGRAEEWGSLLIEGLGASGRSIGALVKVPIDPEWATCREMTPKN